jgi:hypothetical protein
VEYVQGRVLLTYENRKGWRRGNEICFHIELNIEDSPSPDCC